MKRARILLADDHTLILDALQQLLQPEFEVVGAVPDGRALLKAAEVLKPDLVVADIGMPLLNGLDAGEQLKLSDPKIRIIYLTQNRDPVFAVEALRRNASGYLLKNSAASELIQAIREVLQGRLYVSPLITKEMLRRGLSLKPHEMKPRELSPREHEVLQLLAEGKSMKEVGGILHISTRTVEFHKYRIMEILGARTNAELVQYAIKHGLVVP